MQRTAFLVFLITVLMSLPGHSAQGGSDVAIVAHPGVPVDNLTFAEVDGGVQWEVRIGIHSGPVVAGVVGIQKFAFDIWGDTVNYASRMESTAAPGSINLSERTFSRVKDFSSVNTVAKC